MSFATDLLGIFTNTITPGVTYADLTSEGITLVAPSGTIIDICFNWSEGPMWTLEAYRGADRRNHIITIPCDTTNAIAYADSIMGAA